VKKVFALLFCLMLSIGTAQAAALPASGSTRVDAFSFCELYIERALEWQQTKKFEVVEIRDNYNGFISEFLPPSDYLEVQCAAGFLSIDPSDYSLHEFQTPLIVVSYDKEEAQRLILSAIMAMSALEYTKGDDSLMRITNGTTAANKMYDIFTREVIPKLNDVTFGSLLAGNEYEIYRGNYIYTLTYYDMSDSSYGYKVYYLNAH